MRLPCVVTPAGRVWVGDRTRYIAKWEKLSETNTELEGKSDTASKILLGLCGAFVVVAAVMLGVGISKQ